MKPLLTARMSPELKQQWRLIETQHAWAQQFPMLFDTKDLQLATGKQGRTGYHLVEWLGAILTHHLTGWHAAVNKYQMASHERKRAVVKQLGLSELLLKRPIRFGKSQGPDLLMYAPDFTNWMLVEVKGPNDSLTSKQLEYFRYLEDKSGREVRVVTLRDGALPKAK